MSKLISNRDGGKTDQYGTHLWRQRIFSGEVAEGCMVVANASPDMGVRVQAGTLRIPTGSAPSNFWYEGIIDTASPGEGLTVTTANGSNPRKDYVVAYLDSTVTPSTGVTNNSNSMLKLAVVDGTAAASPSYPNNAAIQAAITGGASSPYIILAGIDVGTSVTQITNSDITDLRSMAFAASSLGYARKTTDFATSSATPVQVTDLTTTVMIPPGDRPIKISVVIPRSYNTHLATVIYSIWDGAVGAGVQLTSWRELHAIAGNTLGVHLFTVETPAAGSKTYNVGVSCDTGTETVDNDATYPAILLVEGM